MATRVVSGGLGPAAETPLVQGVEGHQVTAIEVIEGARSGALLLEFGASRLEILSGASVWADGAEVRPENPKWREALLLCMAARVLRVDVEAGRELSLAFDNGLRLVVSLEALETTGPDSAAFFDANWNYEGF